MCGLRPYMQQSCKWDGGFIFLTDFLSAKGWYEGNITETLELSLLYSGILSGIYVFTGEFHDVGIIGIVKVVEGKEDTLLDFSVSPDWFVLHCLNIAGAKVHNYNLSLNH